MVKLVADNAGKPAFGHALVAGAVPVLIRERQFLRPYNLAVLFVVYRGRAALKGR